MRRILAIATGVLLLLLAASACGKHHARTAASLTANNTAATNIITTDSALAQLDALAKPDGVDAAQWEQLTSTLRTALMSRGEKITAVAPSGDANRVSDLAFSDDGAGNLVLKWHYRNMGDYDQNGTVGIPDVTPIAMYYGYSYSPADVNSVLAVIDGNGNGVVDIADITPLAMNFGADCAEYALADAAGEAGDFAEVARIPLPDSASGERILLSAPHVLDPARPFVRVVPYDSAGVPGIPSTPLNIAGAKPHITSVYPWFAVTGTEQQFISYADGDAPLYYSWDFGGGAEPNTSSERLPTVTIGAPGAYNAKLTVSNIFGSEEVPFTLTTGVPPEITKVTPIEGDFESPTTFSTTVVGTEPFTTYAWDFGGGAVPNTSAEASPTVTLGEMGDYAASLTVSSHFGTDTYQFNLHVLGWHIELVDGDGPFPTFISLKLDSEGIPHVAYVHDDEGTDIFLKYAYHDETGWHVEVVDDEGDVGWSCSLALGSLGLPHISYFDVLDAAYNPTEDLNYAYYDGSSWHIETVDSEGSAGGSNSLALDLLDRPHIAYSSSLGSGQKHLKYAWNDGSAWNIETADSQDNVGSNCSLALDSLDRPHIGYKDGTNNDVKSAYYDGAGWQVETADSEKGTGGSITLALNSLDYPHISHALTGIGIRDIKYSYYDGLAWRHELLDFENWVNLPSLALDSADSPHVAFVDMDASALMQTSFEGVAWRTETIDASGGENPSLVLDSLDRAHVCYQLGGSLYYAAYY
jgi:uncharacterized protein YejL (UPF0352 family)